METLAMQLPLTEWCPTPRIDWLSGRHFNVLRTRFPLLLFTAVFATAPGHAQTQPTFFQPYSLGNSGNSLATADFNGDGNLDVAIAGSDLTVALGNGHGSFHRLAPLAYNAADRKSTRLDSTHRCISHA